MTMVTKTCSDERTPSGNPPDIGYAIRHQPSREPGVLVRRVCCRSGRGSLPTTGESLEGFHELPRLGPLSEHLHDIVNDNLARL